MCSKMMRTMAAGNRPMIVRVLVLILMILVMIMSPLANFAEAHAIAVVDDLAVAGIVVIIGAILVAGGLIVATQDQLRQIAQSVWDGIQGMGDDAELLINELWAIHKAVFGAQSQGISAALHVSARLWDAIFSKFVTDKIVGTDIVCATGDVVTVTADNIVYYIEQYNLQANNNSVVLDGITYFYELGTSKTNLYKIVENQKVKVNGWYESFSNLDNKFITRIVLGQEIGGRLIIKGERSIDGVISTGYFEKFNLPIDLTFPSTVIPYQGSVALPAPDSLVKVPDLPTQDDKGEIAWPDIPLLPEDARIHDIPDAVGDLTIPDIPYDKVIDAATGAVVGDVVVPDVPDVPTVPDWPTTGDLSIPALIVSKFPFCIPFDVANMIGMLQAEPIEPVFHVPLKYGKIMDYDLVIDFSKFSDVIKIIRWGEQILFIAGLAYATRNYIKW